MALTPNTQQTPNEGGTPRTEGNFAADPPKSTPSTRDTELGANGEPDPTGPARATTARPRKHPTN